MSKLTCIPPLQLWQAVPLIPCFPKASRFLTSSRREHIFKGRGGGAETEHRQEGAEPGGAQDAQPIIDCVTTENAAYLCAKTLTAFRLTWTVCDGEKQMKYDEDFTFLRAFFQQGQEQRSRAETEFTSKRKAQRQHLLGQTGKAVF